MHNNIMAAGQPATDESLEVREQTVEIFSNISPENKVHHDVEKEAIHFLLNGIGDEIYLTVNACKIAHDMWITIERLQQAESLNKQDVGSLAYLPLEMESQLSQLPQIAKPIKPPSESASEEDNDPEQAQRDKDMQKNLALIVKAKDYTYHKEKMLLCKQDKKGVPLQAEQADWIEDTDEEIYEQELEAHYSFMAKIQEVLPADSGSDPEPLEKRVVLANLIANLKLDTDENKKIQKQLKKANTSLSHELQECKFALEECKSSLEKSNRTRDRYLGLLAQKEHDINKGLKIKAYEVSVVKEKHDELVKRSLLTKSSYEGLVKEKNKVIKDLRSIQTIHMLAPKGLTYNGRPTFANPMYLKKAQSEKPCLYEIPYDKCDHANLFSPNREETLTLEQESRSKLNKDLVKPYDYTKQNSLYENFKPPSREYLDQLAHAGEIQKKIWRKSFVKSKPHIIKNISFLPTQKSIRKSRQAYNVMTNNINHFKEIVDLAWEKHTYDKFRAPTTEDMTVLLKNYLLPLALKTENDSFIFVNELKQEMFTDLQYVQSLEKEIDELESDKANFSNIYDLLLQECVSKDVMCSYLHSLSDLDAHTELQHLYLYKSKNVNLKKLIKKCKGKSVETKFDKPSVVRQTNALKIPKPSVLGNLTPFSDSLERKSFPKTKLVTKTNVSEEMYQIDTRTTQTRASQLPQTSRNTNPRVSTSTRVIHNTSVSRPQFRSTQMKEKVMQDNSQVKSKKTEGNDLLIGIRGSDLYTISLQETSSPTTICFLAKSSPTQAWVWHRRLSHLNFDTINLISKKDIVNGLPKLKYVKDQLCSSCELSKEKRSTFKTKVVPCLKGRLNLLHMDLYGLMRVESINGKKYILFLNKTLHAYFKEEGIEHQTSTPRIPKQNGVVKRQNRTLVEAAQMMLLASKIPLFFWAKAIATACYTQNRSLIISRYEKTPYHIISGRKPSFKHLYIFGFTCYITRDGENLDQMKEKGDTCILVGYSTQSKGYRVYNKRIRLIVEPIHINFDEIKELSKVDYDNSGPAPQLQKTSDHNSSELETHDHSNEPSRNSSIPKSSSPSDNSQQQDTHPTTHTQSTTAPITPTKTVEENNTDIQEEIQSEDAQIDENEFYNIFSTPVREEAESSTCYVDSSNMHTFYQHHQSEHRWTYHPLEQVRGNLSKLVQTR
ncbi:reverse transcriptase domain-containing protein [Tanacetum coccineum]|uniref:Reverse transcriptase domain-containing protein n=1 Tax=Tanacetum coccineum TaxID=301880 RepID=A0ABQ5JDQ1_9ASTR